MEQNTTAPTESNSARKRRLAAEFNAARAVTPSSSTLTRTERDELNALSKEVFGSTSRWQKLINSGYPKLLTEKVTELVPATEEGKEDTTREVDVPVKRANGTYQSVLTRYTVDGIREYMLERKKQLDLIRAEIKKRQEEAKVKQEQEKLALKVHEELQGSAL